MLVGYFFTSMYFFYILFMYSMFNNKIIIFTCHFTHLRKFSTPHFSVTFAIYDIPTNLSLILYLTFFCVCTHSGSLSSELWSDKLLFINIFSLSKLKSDCSVFEVLLIIKMSPIISKQTSSTSPLNIPHIPLKKLFYLYIFSLIFPF